MPTEPIQFDMNGDPIRPTRPTVADVIRSATTPPWAALARDIGTAAGPGLAISDMAVIGGDLHVRFVGSRRWEPVRHMSRAEAGLPTYTAGDNYATPLNHGNHPMRVATADTAYERDRLRRADLAAELGALNPTDQPPNPTRERLNPEWVETPLTPPPPPPPLTMRRGRTAEERARDAAAAERRRSDPPHDGPSLTDLLAREAARPSPWTDLIVGGYREAIDSLSENPPHFPANMGITIQEEATRPVVTPAPTTAANTPF